MVETAHLVMGVVPQLRSGKEIGLRLDDLTDMLAQQIIGRLAQVQQLTRGVVNGDDAQLRIYGDHPFIDSFQQGFLLAHQQRDLFRL